MNPLHSAAPHHRASEPPLWSPSPERVQQARISAFTEALRRKYQQGFPDYHSLWRWSLANKTVFWREVWAFTGLPGELGSPSLINGHLMPGAQWFPEGRLNFAEALLRHTGPQAALVFCNEEQGASSPAMLTTLSRDELRAEVGRMQAALNAVAGGIGETDVVASLLPNIPEAVIAMLGATSLGATWSSCSPDFGVEGVLDRFSQINPKVLFAVDGYYYNGKYNDVRDKVIAIAERLPSLERVVWVSYGKQSPASDIKPTTSNATQNAAPLSAAPTPNPVHPEPAAKGLRLEETRIKPFAAAQGERNTYVPRVDHAPALHTDWHSFLPTHAAAPSFPQFPFNHPLLVAYSSGTTGVPKCIVHGAGGTLLQQAKEHVLHGDLHEADRLFYFSTTGWVMWNWLIAGLCTGASVMLYDGSPFAQGGKVLWDYAEAAGCTHFGVSAKYIDAIAKLGIVPRRSHELPHLRTIYSTGSPLLPESFDYLYQCVKTDVHVASISGGTDIMSCFALGNPTLPVYRGQLQCRGLGMAVDVFDDEGKSLAHQHGQTSAMGELVCTQSFPAMPLYFASDPDGARYQSAYFERYPGLWHHGDWCRITAEGGMEIVGRSDATLNPGGVRIGTAEIYRQLAHIPEVIDSVAIGQHYAGDTRVVLFVQLQPQLTLTDALIETIKTRIRTHTTPRHVPAKIVQVTDIPRTQSNKVVELAVRDTVHGRPVKNLEALANPEALAQFRQRVELM